MTAPLRRFPALLATALAVPALLMVGSPTASAAGPAPMRDICLPIPLPIPCLPDLPGTTPPTATTPTSISGSPKVDLVLSATAPVWSDPSAVTTYRWQRDGADISGASAQTYTVQAADIGKDLTVVATGTVNLLSSGTSTSDPVIGLVGAPPTPTRDPSITGNAKVGGELTAVPGAWTGVAPTFSYQWYRAEGSGVGAITGATEKTYAPKVGDAGSKLAVIVTAEQPGHEAGRAGATVTIARRTSTTTLTSTTKQVPAGRQAVVRLTIASQGGTPTGTVQIFDGGKKIDTVKVGTRAHGTISVTLPKLKVGKHALVAKFVGTPTIAPSASKKLALTVTR